MDPHAALKLLDYLRTCYPCLLFVLFIVAFIASTVSTARKFKQSESPRMGPGGRQLPQRSRSSGIDKTQGFSKSTKQVFNWLSAAVLLTFLADATIYIVHVMVARSEHWWRGQSVVVRLSGEIPSSKIAADGVEKKSKAKKGKRPRKEGLLTIGAGLHRRLFFRLRGLTHDITRYHPIPDTRSIRLLVGCHPD